MAEEKKMSKKSQFIVLAVIAVVAGGLWLFKTVNPKAYKDSEHVSGQIAVKAGE